MYAVTVTFHVKPEHWEAFLPHMQRQAEQSLRLEASCRIFDVWVSEDHPYQVFLHEIYDSPAAFGSHVQSAHFKSFDRIVAPWVERKEVKLWTTRLETPGTS